MDTKNNAAKADHDKRGEQQKQERPRQYSEDIRKRLNPRYVFNDPDSFFSDLLMEQHEQG